jgi:hypothetical protein
VVSIISVQILSTRGRRKGAENPSAGTINPLFPCKGRPHQTPMECLTPVRHLVSASLAYNTWFLRTRCAGASCGFRLQTSSGPQGQAPLPAPGTSSGDLWYGSRTHPAAPGSAESPSSGGSPIRGEIPTPLFAIHLYTGIIPGCQPGYSPFRPSCPSCQPWQPERSIFLTESPIITPASSTPSGSSRGQCLSSCLDKP